MILPTWCGHTTTAPIPAGPGLPQRAQLRARLNDGPGSAPTRRRISQPHQAAGRAWSCPRYSVVLDAGFAAANANSPFGADGVSAELPRLATVNDDADDHDDVLALA